MSSERNFNGGETYGCRLENLLTVSLSVFNVQPNRVPDVGDRLLVGLPLAVTTLQGGATYEVAVLVMLHDDRKRQVVHGKSIFSREEARQKVAALSSTSSAHSEAQLIQLVGLGPG